MCVSPPRFGTLQFVARTSRRSAHPSLSVLVEFVLLNPRLRPCWPRRANSASFARLQVTGSLAPYTAPPPPFRLKSNATWAQSAQYVGGGAICKKNNEISKISNFRNFQANPLLDPGPKIRILNYVFFIGCFSPSMGRDNPCGGSQTRVPPYFHYLTLTVSRRLEMDQDPRAVAGFKKELTMT